MECFEDARACAEYLLQSKGYPDACDWDSLTEETRDIWRAFVNRRRFYNPSLSERFVP